jgi:hypothetical protein
MGCGCGGGQQRQEPKELSKRDQLILDLKRGLVELIVKSKCQFKDKNVKLYVTLSKKATPSPKSKQNKRLIRRSDDDLILWTSNKNYDNNLDAEAGWVKISFRDIVRSTFIDEIRTT